MRIISNLGLTDGKDYKRIFSMARKVRMKKGVLRLIYRELIDQGYTQSWLAEKLGYTEGWMSQIFNGDIPLTVDMLVEISKVLNVEPGRLVFSIAHPELSFEEFMRKVAREEAEKLLPKSGRADCAESDAAIKE